MITRDELLKRLKERSYRPLHVREMLIAFRIPKEERRAFKGLIKELLRDGELIKTRKNQYGHSEKMSLVVGKLQCHRDGYGFVIPDKTGESDIFIPNRNLSGAMHRDRVVTRVEHLKEGAKREGRIIRVLERAHKRIVGRYESGKPRIKIGVGYVVPNDPRIGQDLYIGPKDRKDVRGGDIVVAEILNYPTPTRGPEGKIIKVLGRPDDPGIVTDIIVEEYELSQKFPSNVMADAKSLPQKVTKAMFKGRRDLRDLKTVTIDGERAMDFDDAVSVKRLSGGSILLWVHIADVGYYVPWDSPLDEEARARGTSVYFPDRVIPMLPKELSNGICSLNPREDRLAVTMEMEFDREGNRIRYDFYDSEINSNERMTYTSVKKILQGDTEECRRYSYLIDDFKMMEELCHRLRNKRIRRGSLDFDLPEPDIVLDLRGEIKDIFVAERNIAHRIIEEFMIAANEAVACHMAMLQVPFIYRIHEEPDPEKMEEFLEFLRGFGHILTKKKIHPKSLQKILEEIRDKPEERLINNVMLRSMKQAIYSAENLGHFGLASQCYTHFTSPIRRYPDLIVHRLLREVRGGPLKAKRREYFEKVLPEIATHSSGRERIADEAEREVVDSLKVRFMKDKLGEEYEGVITGVTSYGLFVELKDIFVEGLVHVSTLRDDYYIFNEKAHLLKGEHKKRVYRLGDKVKVSVDRVDIERGLVDFSLIK